MEKPTLQDVLNAQRMYMGKMPFDLKYDVDGSGKVDLNDVLGIQKASLGKDPGFVFATDTFLSPVNKTAEDYAKEKQQAEEKRIADEKETARQKTLLAEAQKLSGSVTADMVAKNPSMTAQQLASLAQKNYWSNESEAFSRVMTAMENGTAKLISTEDGLAITEGGHPGYDTLYLNPTNEPNVYSFSTRNQVAGGNIHGVIAADPKTGKYAPIQDYTKQISYTPGSSGSFFGGLLGSVGDMFKDLGPIGVILGNAVTPGLGTALGVITAIDEGADPTDIAKNIAVGEIFNQSGISPEVAAATDSKVLGDLVQDTIKNITLGNDLETSIQNAVLSAGPRNINEFESEINDILDLPANVDTGIVGPMPDAGSLGAESDLPIENIFQTPIDSGSLGVASDLPPTLDDIIQTLPPVDAGSLGQESDLPEIPPSDAEMPPTQGLDTTLPPAPPTLDEVLQGVKDVAKVAALVNTADSVLNPPTQETVKKGFDIVPVPTEWKSPTYDQTFTPVDLDSIFKNLQGTQYQWKPRPDITGGAYMGSPVNISDIVNKIMSAELTPTTMPSQITNAVGGILGPTATR